MTVTRSRAWCRAFAFGGARAERLIAMQAGDAVGRLAKSWEQIDDWT
jgi:hypothetical protein